MLIQASTELGSKTKIVDAMGKVIPLVKSFDTETKDAELFISTKLEGKFTGSVAVVSGPSGNEVLVIKCKLLGCKAIDRKTLREIK